MEATEAIFIEYAGQRRRFESVDEAFEVAQGIYEKSRVGLKALQESMRELGDFLLALRPKVPHGNWHARLRDYGIHRKTAERSMRLAMNRRTGGTAGMKDAPAIYPNRVQNVCDTVSQMKCDARDAFGEDVGDVVEPVGGGGVIEFEPDGGDGSDGSNGSDGFDGEGDDGWGLDEELGGEVDGSETEEGGTEGREVVRPTLAHGVELEHSRDGHAEAAMGGKVAAGDVLRAAGEVVAIGSAEGGAGIHEAPAVGTRGASGEQLDLTQLWNEIDEARERARRIAVIPGKSERVADAVRKFEAELEEIQRAA